MSKGPVSFSSATPNPYMPGVEDISPGELIEKCTQVHLIDVRMPDEFTGDLGHIANSKLVVLNTLPERIGEFPKNEPIVFICRSGARSAQAAAWAREEGFQSIFNLKGGMMLWNQMGLETQR